jgi:prostaglandin-endoperoxide synthase 2
VADTFFDDIAKIAGHVVNGWSWLDTQTSKLVINNLVGCTRNRPHPWSTASEYTSWKSLTDRSYQARQMQAVTTRVQPEWKDVMPLFQRPTGKQLLSEKSTCLFPAFAQYLTDGFIRTGLVRQDPIDRTRTTSNHDIDLCPLYGRTEEQTNILRKKEDSQGNRGRLKSQMIAVSATVKEEFPPYLYINDGKTVDPSFEGLDPPLLPPGGVSSVRLATLFAVGGDRANSTPFAAMLNTLLLREHNRVAGELEKRNPSWDDERVFQTARNIMIPMFIKIVVEQYINHITPMPFNLVADPSVAWTADWNRPNWISAEFSLLYRWHSLMPDAIKWPGGDIPLTSFGLDNAPLTKVGLLSAFLAAAAQPAAELGALNTSEALLPIEWSAVSQARINRIGTYNQYRMQYGMSPAKKFSDISSNPDIQEKLAALYGSPDDVEFYPGLFAEDRVPKSPLPGLLLRMVGVDAFSQALTNPLLSQHVFNAETFTEWGFNLINQTKSLGDILVRQGAAVDPKKVTMTQASWSY